MNGIELYRVLAEAGHNLPIILIADWHPRGPQSIIARIPAFAFSTNQLTKTRY